MARQRVSNVAPLVKWRFAERRSVQLNCSVLLDHSPRNLRSAGQTEADIEGAQRWASGLGSVRLPVRMGCLNRRMRVQASMNLRQPRHG